MRMSYNVFTSHFGVDFTLDVIGHRPDLPRAMNSKSIAIFAFVFAYASIASAKTPSDTLVFACKLTSKEQLSIRQRPGDVVFVIGSQNPLRIETPTEDFVWSEAIGSGGTTTILRARDSERQIVVSLVAMFKGKPLRWADVEISQDGKVLSSARCLDHSIRFYPLHLKSAPSL